MSTVEFKSDDSWKELVADKPIIYSHAQLLKLRHENKFKWRKYLNLLWQSQHFKDLWSFKGSEHYHCAVFEPHHKKEGIYFLIANGVYYIIIKNILQYI